MVITTSLRSVTSRGVTIAAPLLAGRFADLWFLALIVVAVGGAAVLVRLFQGYQFDQAHLRTGLAIGDERTRVARDVHDVLGHSVTAAILKVELCQRLLDGVDADSEAGRARLEQCRHHLADLESISRGALAEIRSTVGGLRATDLADEVTAARTVLADADVDLLVTGDMADIPERHRPMLAWVAREAVTNIVRHAKAERCHIELAPGSVSEGILLRVTDDGVGLGTAEEGNGLRGLRERVAASGARVHIEAADTPADTKASGTRIEVSL
jgi:two-component system sensor histidine kinase DesK